CEQIAALTRFCIHESRLHFIEHLPEFITAFARLSGFDEPRRIPIGFPSCENQDNRCRDESPENQLPSDFPLHLFSVLPRRLIATHQPPALAVCNAVEPRITASNSSTTAPSRQPRLTSSRTMPRASCG